MKYGSLFKSTVSNASFLNLSLLSKLACSEDCKPPPPCFEFTRSWSNILAVTGYVLLGGGALRVGGGESWLAAAFVRERAASARGDATGWLACSAGWGSGALRSRSGSTQGVDSVVQQC